MAKLRKYGETDLPEEGVRTAFYTTFDPEDRMEGADLPDLSECAFWDAEEPAAQNASERRGRKLIKVTVRVEEVEELPFDHDWDDED